MSLTRDQIRARIDALECLSDVQTAISEVQGVEWTDGERRTFGVDVTAGQAVTFVHGVPPLVLLAGLRAMERELLSMADAREAA